MKKALIAFACLETVLIVAFIVALIVALITL